MTPLEISKALTIKDGEDRDLALLNLLPNFVKQNDWKSAKEIVNNILGKYEKTEAYLVVYQELKDSDSEKSLENLRKAMNEAILADEEWQKAELLSKIGKEFFNIGQIKLAEETWKKAVEIATKGEQDLNKQNSLDCSSVLSEIALNLKKAGMPNEGIKVATNISNKSIRERTLQQI